MKAEFWAADIFRFSVTGPGTFRFLNRAAASGVRLRRVRWQRDGYAEPLDRELLPALEAERARRVREDAAAVEPTRVDFFTLVRGED